jgi:hypothetical protein
MIGTAPIYSPGDHVLALCGRGSERYWRPGVVRSVNSASARVDLGGSGPSRVPLSRLRLSAAR